MNHFAFVMVNDDIIRVCTPRNMHDLWEYINEHQFMTYNTDKGDVMINNQMIVRIYVQSNTTCVECKEG